MRQFSPSASNLILATAAFFLLHACSSPDSTVAEGTECSGSGFVVDDSFAGARRGPCDSYADGHVTINIYPEDDGPINDSPWYAFRVVPSGANTAQVEIRYYGGSHRYWPKRSDDGANWYPLEKDAVHEHHLSGNVTLDIDLQGAPVWIAAQELILVKDMTAWSDLMATNDDVVLSILGESIGSEDVLRLDINAAADEVVFLPGRQHPPEVTGAIAFMAFYETIAANTDLANAFRERFHIISFPMLNPDGVQAGNWRHNLGGVDLNRDWGPFTQPETQLVGQVLDSLDALGKSVVVSVDFHSTAKNVIYRQEDSDPTRPLEFTQQWIAASLARLPGYEFSDEPRPTTDLATSRNYMFKRYNGIPAVTYEVADEEDRDTIRQSAQVFAEEFMRLLLATPTPSEQT